MPDDTTSNVDAITDDLTAIERFGYGRARVFRDWTRLMLHALRRDDEDYCAVMDRYDEHNDREWGDRPADHFASAFGKLRRETRQTGLDVLGDVYMQYGSSSDALGQYFTPHAVAEFLAEIGGDATSADDGVRRVCDPACGSGRLLIYDGRRYDDAVLAGVDKDATCARMTAINFALLRVNGVAIHGDSLTLDEHTAWRTHPSPGFAQVPALVEADPEESLLAGAFQ